MSPITKTSVKAKATTCANMLRRFPSAATCSGEVTKVVSQQGQQQRHASFLSIPSKMSTQTTVTPSTPFSRRSFTLTPGLSSTDVLKPEWTTPKKEGDHIPNVEFLTRVRVEPRKDEPHPDPHPLDWKKFTTNDLFAGRRCVVFALPGAFTPVCSTTHLPGFEKVYDDVKEVELDDVYCLSVNDAFVMRQWGLKMGLEEDFELGTMLGFSKLKLLPDGAAHFTRGMGMSCLWEHERGFGERSWRYSMVVNDCVIEKMFVEPGRTHNSGPDPIGVSDAKTMMDYLNNSDWPSYDE